jgi:hypothetical protein
MARKEERALLFISANELNHPLGVPKQGFKLRGELPGCVLTCLLSYLLVNIHTYAACLYLPRARIFY